MRLAILGATSQIAQDLVQSFANQSTHDLVLFARRPEAVSQWQSCVGLVNRYRVAEFSEFSTNEHFDGIINFVGVGDPAAASAMGASIFDVTLKYDQLALDYLAVKPECRYIFLSSGAAYGSNFEEPVDEKSASIININNIKPQDWYGIAKLYAESKHRSLSHLSIIDIRVFNYFSHTQNIASRFFITDLLRSIRDGVLFETTDDEIIRDYLCPSDFFSLVSLLIGIEGANKSVDCYSKSPVSKGELLRVMQKEFNLRYLVVSNSTGVNATGFKKAYYSKNLAAKFFGYEPSLTSLEGLLNEFSVYLEKSRLSERAN